MPTERSVEQLVAHRPPMLLLDRVVSVDEESACCEVTVIPDMVFTDDRGELPGWVGIELMAQTIAVWGGNNAKFEGGNINVGLLLGSRKYETSLEKFPVYSRLRIEAQKVVRDGSLGIFKCCIKCREEVVARAQVNAYLPDNKELMTILTR